MMRLTAPSSFTLLLMTSAVINVSIDSWRKNARILKLTVKRSTQDLFIARPTLRRQPKKLTKTAANSYHKLMYDIRTVAKYRRGRPAKGKPRTPIGYEYLLDVKIEVDANAVAPLRLEAGCFVLLTNLSSNKEQVQWPTVTLLALYKNQSGIEQNFGFLKDPVIVNAIFLKKPKRIEVLGLILVIALLIWRLMERCMRQHLERTQSEISGWKNRPTKRPTSFMMTTKFLSILVAKSGNQRQLVRPLKSVQLEFLQAMLYALRNNNWRLHSISEYAAS
jgi:transposase